MLKMNYLLRRSLPSLICRVITQPSIKRAHHSLSTHFNPALSNFRITNTYNDIIRHKSKRKTDEESDDEQDFLDDDKTLSKDSKVMKFSTTSLRTDAVLKSALGVARNKIEELFYESKIRVNGRKIIKKSTPVREEYEIDVIKSVSPKNPDHIYVARVEVLKITAGEENISFTVRRFKNLLIENYEKDPYKGGNSEDK